MGYSVARQQPVDIEFDGMRFEAAFRIDILVDERLLVEIKSVERLSAAHSKQLLTYLRLMQRPVGLLIKLGGETLKEGLAVSSTTTGPPRLRVNQNLRSE